MRPKPDFEVFAPSVETVSTEMLARFGQGSWGLTRADYLLLWACARDLDMRCFIQIRYAETPSVILRVLFRELHPELP